MNEFFDNPTLAAVQFQGNSSDSEPEGGEIPVQERVAKNNKKKNIITIQKYYKASKIMKFTDNSGGLEEDGKYFKNKSQQAPSSNSQLRNKTNQSLKGNKLAQLERK